MSAPRISVAGLPAVVPPAADAGRSADIATIIDHQGHRPTDEMVFDRVVRRLGWDMLTEEALRMLAREHEAHAAHRERLDAENRALRAGGRA